MTIYENQTLNDLTEDPESWSEMQTILEQINENFTMINQDALGKGDSIFTAKEVTTSVTLTRNARLQYVRITAGAALTVTLPAGDVNNTYVKKNDTFILKDVGYNAEIYNTTVNLNGGKINGDASNITCAKNGFVLFIKYGGWDSVNGWGLWEIIYKDINNFIRDNPTTYDKRFYNASVSSGNIPAGYVTFVSESTSIAPFFSVRTGISPAVLYTAKCQGTFASPSAVLSGDVLSGFRFLGFDGTNWNSNGARYQILADENWSTTAAGSYHVFSVTPNGTLSPAFAFSINTDKSTTSYGKILPSASATHDIGTAGNYFANGYIQNAWNVMSDGRLKHLLDIENIGEDFILKLVNCNAIRRFKWKNFTVPKKSKKEFVEEYSYEDVPDHNGETTKILTTKMVEKEFIEQEEINTDFKKIHTSLHLQKVLEVMNDMGIKTNEFPLVSIDNYKPGDELKWNSESFEELGHLSARIELLIFPLMISVKNHREEIEILKKEIEDLKGKIQ